MELEPVRIIKRYPNRKLYDTSESKYITLKKVTTLIREGDMVKIIDNNSQEDLTHDFLLQIIRTQEKKWKIFPLKSLVHLIRTGTSTSNDFLINVKGEVDQRVSDFPKINDLKEIIETYHKRFDVWQTKIEDQILTLLEAPSNLISTEMEYFKNRLLLLESKVTELKTILDVTKGSEETSKTDIESKTKDS
jgi:polyhydroxyalkanoate synthesis repressor PhaR